MTHQSNPWRRGLFISVLLLAGCAALPLRPAPEKLQPWTTELRAQQPDDAFAAVYKAGQRRLVFVAAQHENQNDSLTFRMIRDAYARFRFDTVIAEGFPTSWGANPARILDYVARSKAEKDGFVEGGETVPTVLGAAQQNAVLLGGEPDDLDIKNHVLARGFSGEDLLGYYILRIVPQWIREREISGGDDRRLIPLVATYLDSDRKALDLPPTTLPDFASWADWYRKKNGKPMNDSFDTEEVGPLADGPFATNKVAYAVSRARDAYLHSLIVRRVNSGESVLVVFGGSHLMIQRPALDAVLGRPCYAGTDLQRAAISCR